MSSRRFLPPHSGWRVLAPLLACVLALATFGRVARADVWGYVDTDGTPHLATERLDDRYELFFRGTQAPPVPAGEAALQGDLAAFSRTRIFQRVALHPNARRFAPLIEREARARDLDPALVKALIAVESSFDPQAVSVKGALGLMQIVPETAARYGVADDRKRTAVQKLLDPVTNLRTGTRHLADLLAQFGGDRMLALAAYNAGEEAVKRYGRSVPPFPETRDYVKLVEQFYAWYRPPEPSPPPARVEGMLMPRPNLRDLAARALHAQDPASPPAAR